MNMFCNKVKSKNFVVQGTSKKFKGLFRPNRDYRVDYKELVLTRNCIIGLNKPWIIKQQEKINILQVGCREQKRHVCVSVPKDCACVIRN